MRLAFLLVLATVTAGAQNGMRDRYFARYPFAQWLADGDRAQIRWTAKVQPARRAAHQRWIARIEIVVDEKEIEKRRGRGEFVTLVQIENAAGRFWRFHNSYNLATIPPSEHGNNVKVHGVVYVQDVFILPGDYTLSLALPTES